MFVLNASSGTPRIKLKFSFIGFLYIYLMFFSSSVLAADVVSVIVENKSSTTQTNVPFTFGQVFKEGDVSPATDLIAKMSDGRSIPIQVDKKATHADGSLRHGIVTATIPSLAGNASEVITLATGADTSGATITLDKLIASGFDAKVSLTIINTGGGTGQTYEVSAKDLLQSGTPKSWLSGDLVSEWIVGGPVKTGSSVPHEHLAAYFHVRAYGGSAIDRVRVDVVVENGWTMVPGPDKFTYNATVTVGGSVVDKFQSLGQKHHSRWRKTYWWGQQPQVYVKQDVDYLQATKAVPNYEISTINESYLAGLRSRNIAPMDNGDFRVKMGTTGASPTIAPLPRWVAAYLITGDERAYNAVLANGDAGGAYYSHYRDEIRGIPMTIADYPNADLQSYDGAGKLPSPSGGTDDLEIKLSHLPSIAYVPYLITGDYFYLEELQFWGNWGIIWREKKARNYADGILHGTQVRGQAWGLRELGRTAYVTPDVHPLKSYFETLLQNNITWYTNNYALSSGAEYNELGVIDPNTGTATSRTADRPWMDDFFTYAIGHIVELGYTSAISLRDFKLKYVIGRVGENGKYCWQFPTRYSGSVGTSDTDYYPDFDTYWENNFGGRLANDVALRDVACGSEAMRTWMDNYDPDREPHKLNQIIHVDVRPSVTTSYYANMQPAAAMAVDAGLPGSELVRERFFEITPVRPDYRSAPEWAVSPRTTRSGPGVIFSASSLAVSTGGSVELTWTADPSATGCTASGDWSGSKSVTGKETIASITTSKTFHLSCTDGTDTTLRTLAVSIGSGGSGGDVGSGSSGSNGITLSGTNPSNYKWGVLAIGKKVYVDRNYVFELYDTEFNGLDYLMTANDDKASTGDGYLTFNVDKEVTVYVAHTQAGANLPVWLSSWQDTGKTFDTSDRILNIYKKDFAAGPVTLGGNESSSTSMYIVAVAKVNGGATTGTDGGGGTGTEATTGTDGAGGTGTKDTDADISGSDSGAATGGAGSFDPIMLFVLTLVLILFRPLPVCRNKT